MQWFKAFFGLEKKQQKRNISFNKFGKLDISQRIFFSRLKKIFKQQNMLVLKIPGMGHNMFVFVCLTL